jgi:DNA-binding transcriptional LysR family regulator
MEMHQIRYFLAVAEILNFTRAAEKCHVSQPALTRAIQTLEDELGGPLFHRERNHTHLTELGKMMHPYLTQVLAQSEAAKERAKGFANLKEAPLHVGVMCTIGPGKLIELFAGFRERNAGIDVNLRDATAETLTTWLAAGELDLAIFGVPSAIDERFHALDLFEEQFLIGVCRTHRFAKLNAVRAADMHEERYLARTNCEYWDFMRDLYLSKGVKLNVPYRSERDDWVQAMACAGLGVTFIPEHAVTIESLVTRPLIEPEVRRTIKLVTVRGRPQSPAVGAFVREAMRWRNKFAPKDQATA